jgi:enoyl-[acyl-carrier-protein] reductase (NADH)
MLARLAAALQAEFVAVPSATTLESWRADASNAVASSRVVVAAWTAEHVAGNVVDIDGSTFAARAEQPFIVWYLALGHAVRRCADNGAIVAIIERPSPLDCAGWAPESGIADAVEAFVRSLARSEGHRGVRVNAVTTPHRLVPARVAAPRPPLANYPGTLEVEVLNAVAMLLGPGVAGVTGTVIHADSGRSWR